MVRFFLSLTLVSAIWVKAQDYKRAPNSYVYDVDYAELNHFGGLMIPVKKAYEVWSDPGGFLNSPIPSGTQSAYVYWEDVPGLIREVSITGSGANSNIKVAVNKGKGKGNAVISLHVGSNGNHQDPIYWTWHVWVTDDPTNGLEYSKGFETNLMQDRFDPVHMDRNLGAVNAHFLGNDWNRSAGLLYQWGRKDPFPPLLHKDRTYYELNGLVGNITDEDVHLPNEKHYTMKKRPSDNPGTNIKYAVQHPIEFLIQDNAGTWFSATKLKSTNPNIAWDLWSDNFKGGLSNANSSNPTVAADSKSYELKSVYDPCPGGWRVVSNYGREAVNNNLSPYGRGGGGNDDIYNAYVNGQFVLDPNVNGGKPSSTFLHNKPNPVLPDLVIYPKLGFDFRQTNRNLGLIPTSGKFVLYKTNGEFSHVIYQDELADGGLWSATYGSSNPRFVYMIADADQPDNGVGRYNFKINEVEHTSAALNVRCIKDPNENQIGYFSTNYIQTPEFIEYTKGLNDPNSYLVENTHQALLIPVNKAFSVFNQLLTDNGAMLPSDDLKANVLWTTNPDLIDKISLIPSSDPKDSKIKVEFKTNQTGNAVVSLHNGNIQNPVYWSWHIWVPQSSVRTVSYTTESTLPTPYHLVNLTKSKYPPLTTLFMDRNLGAMESFPNVSNPNSPNSTEIAKIAASGGFHYQWGRKDPIPSFKNPGTEESYQIYKGVSINGNGEPSYQSIDANQYASYYTEAFTNYSVMAGVQAQEDKNVKATKILKYAAQNPMTFLYHAGQGSSYTGPNSIDYPNMRDWASASVGANGERALKADRWGHASSKSPFDPCPEGWRVPDMSVVLLRTSGKGTSPWYYGDNGSNGINQADYHKVETYYNGQVVKIGNTTAGLMFESDSYGIGNFPKTGSRGELGDADLNPTTGVWTAAMSDYMTGYAMAMQFNKENYLRSGVGVYPQAALNVRCAKDLPRYVGNDSFMNNEEIFISENESIVVYPNPVYDNLFIQSDKEYEFAIYDLNGRLIQEGKTKGRQIDFSYVNKGVYILVLDQKITKKIIKK